MSDQRSIFTSLGRNLHSPDKDGVSSLSSRRWLWLRAAAIGNVRSLAKVRCSLSRCDASCLWVAAPFCTLGSRRAIGHNRHEGNEAKVAADLRDEQTKKRLYMIFFHHLPCVGLYLGADQSSQACQIEARDLQRFKDFLFSQHQC